MTQYIINTMIKYELTHGGRRPWPIDKFSSKVERGGY